MSFNTKIFEIIEPKSYIKPEYADFEFLIRWYYRNGGYQQYMFTNWSNNIKTDVDILNLKDSDMIENIPMSEDRTVRLTAEDLTKNDLNAMLSIKLAKLVERIFNDGTKERIGIDSNSITYNQAGGRYNFEFNIILYQRALPQ